MLLKEVFFLSQSYEKLYYTFSGTFMSLFWSVHSDFNTSAKGTGKQYLEGIFIGFWISMNSVFISEWPLIRMNNVNAAVSWNLSGLLQLKNKRKVMKEWAVIMVLKFTYDDFSFTDSVLCILESKWSTSLNFTCKTDYLNVRISLPIFWST